MKKTIALFVSLVLAFSSLLACVVPTAAAGTDSYLFDFETGRETEFVNSSTCSNDICTENPRSGDYCIVVRPTAADRYIARNGIAVEENTDYAVGFWYRGQPWFTKVRVYIGSSDVEMTLAGSDVTLNDWAYGEIHFNSGDNDSVNVRFLPSSGHDIYFDDISIKKYTAPAEDPENVFPDGSFESGSLGDWSITSSVAAISRFNPHSGSYSMRVFPKGSKYSYPRVLRTVTVEPNTDYTFSFWFSGSAGYQQIVIRDMDNQDLEDTDYWKICTDTDFSPTQRFYTYTFNSGDNTQLKLGFRSVSYSTSDDRDYFIDDICLKKAPPADEYECGFESGAESEFVTRSDAGYELCTENPHSGTYCLAITPTANDQKVRRENMLVVEPDTDYTVSFWYRGRPYYAYARVGVADVYDYAQITMFGKDTVLEDWAYGEINFNSGSYTAIDLLFGTSGAGNDYFIDDIKVEKKVAAEPDPDNIFPDGSFESESLSGWSNANSIGSIAKFNPNSGSNCLRVNDGTQYSRITRTVAVEPYTDYDFGFWYCGNTAWQQIVIRTASDADIADSENISTDDSFCVTRQYYTCRFNSGNNTELKFGFRQCRAPAKEAFFYVDDISLKKAASKLTASTDGHGTLTWDADALAADDTVSLGAIPAPGYKLYKATLSLDGDSLINADLNDQQLLVPEVDDNFTFVMSTVALKVYGEFTTVTDINSDGSVDIRDLIALKKLCASAEDATGDPSDLNGSDAFDAGDLQMIRQTLLGI